MRVLAVFLFAVMALLVARVGYAIGVGSPKLYAVIFYVDVLSGGEISIFWVEKVIDPDSGTQDAVNVAVPDIYLSTARQAMVKKERDGRSGKSEARHYWTYFFYDPDRPSRIDIDPKSDKKSSPDAM